MNPTIEALYIAVVAGVALGAIWTVLGHHVARDAMHELADRDEVVTDWKATAAEVSEELKDRQKARRARVDTLRGIYLAGLEIDAERPEEVPAR